MVAIAGSQFFPGVRQRIRVRLGPSAVGENERILLIGYRDSTASAAFDLAPQRVLDENDAIALFGEGSQLALMVRAAFAVAPLAQLDSPRGIIPEIWAMAVAPPADVGDVPSIHTLTVAGTATATVRMPVEVGDEIAYVQVVLDDTANDIAAKIDTAIQGLERVLPVTSGSAAAVTTLTARDNGEHTNELFIWADARRVPGITVTVARSQAGIGVVDLTAALTASEAGDWAIVVLPQQDTATRDAIKPHITAMWDENTQRRRRVIMPHGGLLTAAAVDAQAIDDWRAMVASTERVVGSGTEWDPAKSSRALSWAAAAAVAARLESQRKANWSFNTATLPVGGRPLDTLTGAAYDAAHQAGVCVITDNPDGNSKGLVSDPISTATTDQTGVTNVTDRTFLPIEIARVVRRIAAEHAVKDAGFAQASSVASIQTATDIKSAGLSVLNDAASNRKGWIQPVTDADIDVEFVTDGGQNIAQRTERYTVIVGIDRVLIIHSVARG